MKINRIITIILSVLMLASAFASCSRRDQFRPPETDVPTAEQTTGDQTTGAGQPNDATADGTTDSSVQEPPVNQPIRGEGNPYEGKTKEELLAMFENASKWSLGVGFNTPYYVILDSHIHNGGQAYSRLTGQVVTLCQDALCTHETCVFKKNTSITALTVTDDRIYVSISETVSGREELQHKLSLYSFDLTFRDPKLVRDWGLSGDGPQNNILLGYGGKILYVDNYYRDGKAVSTTYMLDPETGTSELLWGEELFASVWDIEGDYVYYQDTNRRTVSRYHMVEKTHETVLQDMLDPERGDILCTLSDVVGDRLICSMISMVETYSFIYNMTSKEIEATIKTGGTLCGDRVFYFKDHTDEAYKDDPFYDYYLRQPSETFGQKNVSGGEIWVQPYGGEETRLVYLTTDDIPDHIANLCGFDGRFLYIRVYRYLDYQNELNPNYNPFNTKEYVACIDTQSGTVYKLLEGYGSYTE